MPDIPVEQALFARVANQLPILKARSAGFLDDWLPQVEQLIVGFGDRPPGRPCPWAVFAQPLGEEHVAVICAADQDGVTLAFHVLVISRADYKNHVQDPFKLADNFPPPWSEKGSTLPSLSWPHPALTRTVAEVQAVLKRVKAGALREGEDPGSVDLNVDNSESPALLGGVQVLVDGGKLVFVRPEPDPGLIRGLWTLLPNRDRAELWPATFAFSNSLGFDALVVPHRGDDDYAGYTTEEQAADYPAGRYELSLQTAAEAGDQAALDQLFGRRSSSDTLRLAIIMVVVLSIGLFILRYMERPRPIETPVGPTAPSRETWTPEKLERAATAAAIVGSGNPWSAVGFSEFQLYRKAERAATAAGIVASGDPWTAILQARTAQARYVEVWKK